MTDLIACLTTGKGSWNTVNNVINGESWDRIFLVTNSFGKEKFSAGTNVEFVLINVDDSSKKIEDQIFSQLKDKISFSEVAVNLSSGSGREHMALISALLKLGGGIRIVDFVDNKILVLT